MVPTYVYELEFLIVSQRTLLFNDIERYSYLYENRRVSIQLRLLVSLLMLVLCWIANFMDDILYTIDDIFRKGLRNIVVEITPALPEGV